MDQFQCDYIAGAHPAVLKALEDTNGEEVPGYGEDRFCREAADLIRRACGQPEADVHFFAGGTQVNLTVAAAALRAHQGIVACSSGHIEVHETGAVEATGHKVLTVPAVDGKVTAEALMALCRNYFDDEEKVLLVQPAMLYLSFPTETGTLYSAEELQKLVDVCRRYGLLMYVDGARLAYGLAASQTVTLKTLAATADAFYIGGTKCGTLGGEALVIRNEALKKDFAAVMRRQGALLAKGRFVGVQFCALMKDGLYFEIGRQAVVMAQRLRKAFEAAGIETEGASPTNQQFFRLTSAQAAILGRRFRFEKCRLLDDGRWVVRFCTAWSTRPEALESLLEAVKHL